MLSRSSIELKNSTHFATLLSPQGHMSNVYISSMFWGDENLGKQAARICEKFPSFFFAYLTSKLQIYQGFDQPFTCHATQTYLRSRLSISSSFTSAAPVLSHVDFFQEHRNTKWTPYSYPRFLPDEEEALQPITLTKQHKGAIRAIRKVCTKCCHVNCTFLLEPLSDLATNKAIFLSDPSRS